MTSSSRRMRGAVVVLASALGCSSLDGLATKDAPADGDAGPTVLDAGADGTVITSADGAAPVAGTFCERERTKNHLLCSDFESPFVLDGVWEAQALSPGASLTREEEVAPSGDRGHLLSKTPAIGGSGNSDALVFKYLTKKISKATLAFKMRLGPCTPPGGPDGVIALANVGQGEDDRKWIVSVNLRPGGLVLNTVTCSPTCTGTEVTLPTPADLKVWTRFDLQVDIVQSMAMVQVDQKPAVEKPAQFLNGTTDDVLLNVGNNARGPASACEISYDEITFDAE